MLPSLSAVNCTGRCVLAHREASTVCIDMVN